MFLLWSRRPLTTQKHRKIKVTQKWLAGPHSPKWLKKKWPENDSKMAAGHLGQRGGHKWFLGKEAAKYTWKSPESRIGPRSAHPAFFKVLDLQSYFWAGWKPSLKKHGGPKREIPLFSSRLTVFTLVFTGCPSKKEWSPFLPFWWIPSLGK